MLEDFQFHRELSRLAKLTKIWHFFCQNLTVLYKDTKIMSHIFVYTKTPSRDFILNLKNKFF